MDLGYDIDGLGVLEALRMRLEHELPAVLVTGRFQLPTELPAACAVLQKPVTLEQLALALRGLVDSTGGEAP